MIDLMTVWRAGFVRRWHANPDLSDLDDLNAAHQGRCAMLALALWPEDCSRQLLVACITHDAGEVVVGDLPYTRRDQAFAAALDEAEEAAVLGMGLTPAGFLIDIDRWRLRLVDRLDAYLFVRHRRPHVLAGDGWPEQRLWLLAEADCLGCLDPVAAAFGVTPVMARLAAGRTEARP